MLVRACHPGPTIAVTTLALLLGGAAGLGVGTLALLGLVVLTGQLTIGWSNDLADAERDALVGRADKPLATGELSARVVRGAVVLVLVGSVIAGLGLGLAAGLVHLVLVVGSGWAYNLKLKGTVVSFVPYAVAFGALPAVVQLSATPALLPPPWMLITGATLGVGAHLVNALPDLQDDAVTDVVGLPHRLGERRSRWLAAILLLGGTVVSIIGPASSPPPWVWVGVVIILWLAVVIMVGTGKAPFRAALVVALIDVAVLVQRTLTTE